MSEHIHQTQLDSLELQHSREESAEARRTPIDSPRKLRIELPESGVAVQSDEWLARLYAGGRMAKEKKPNVFDHVRSVGPWMASIDESPMVVLDGMSQTATLTAGFAADAVVRGYFDNAFVDTILTAPDTACETTKAAESYTQALQRAFPETPHVSFTNSGAEANEKALALCRLNAPKGHDRVIAFEGSFHGRTLQALHATWNPVKRTPYELPGFEATFVPFPVAEPNYDLAQLESDAFRGLVARAQMSDLNAQFGQTDDNTLNAELESLLAVDSAIRAGGVYAVIVEPMQSEGGDRYASHRFFRSLRLLTRYHNVSLIFDEVQTGFGLGGLKAWSHGFGLVDVHGHPDFPDATTWAKRAQVGLCLSRFTDPEPTSAHVTSLTRGRLHLDALDDGHGACMVQGWVNAHLEKMRQEFPHLLGDARGQGYAFAFDLPTAEHMVAYIGQRFHRGAVVFAAGTRTIRYRLSAAYGEFEIKQLFKTIKATLQWLTDYPDLKGPKPENIHGPKSVPVDAQSRVRTVTRSEGATLLQELLDIEAATYEPARRDTAETLSLGLSHPDGVAVIAEVLEANDWKIVGSALAAPLECFEHIDGPNHDPHLGANNTAYSIAVTVHPQYQNHGLGKALKDAQLKALRGMEKPDGHRYQFVTGRNRVGLASSMTHVNRIFGGYEVKRLTQQYGDANAQAIYYRIPLRQYSLVSSPSQDEDQLHWADGIARPWSTPPASLRALYDRGALFGPTINKLTICNYVTPAIVRAIEWVGALNPNHPHLYLTSCRDELVDKCIRTLKHSRTEAVMGIGLEGGYLGHTSAGARAISDPAVHRMGTPVVEWPRLTHPSTVPIEQTLSTLRHLVSEAGGPEKILGLFVEPLQERTGRQLDPKIWTALDEFREETGIPLVSFETASAGYRGQPHPFATDALDVIPDIRAWWPGGQTGFIHLTEKYFVSKPLTMVSTWDGDEISLIRCHHHLRALRHGAHEHASKVFEPVLNALRAWGYSVEGSGIYFVMHVGQDADVLSARLRAKGLSTRSFINGNIAFAPPFDLTDADAEKAISILKDELNHSDSM